MSNTHSAPRPPQGEGKAHAPARQREEKQAQLTPETATEGVAPRHPAKAPPEPSPEQPEIRHTQDPAPHPVPADAKKQLPEAKYGKGDPMEPPPETRKS